MYNQTQLGWLTSRERKELSQGLEKVLQEARWTSTLSLWSRGSIQSDTWELVGREVPVIWTLLSPWTTAHVMGQGATVILNSIFSKRFHVYLQLKSLRGKMILYDLFLWIFSILLKIFKTHLLFEMSKALVNVLKYHF